MSSRPRACPPGHQGWQQIAYYNNTWQNILQYWTESLDYPSNLDKNKNAKYRQQLMRPPVQWILTVGYFIIIRTWKIRILIIPFNLQRYIDRCLDIETSQPWSSECPDVKYYKWLLNPVWHMMLYSCTHMATVGFKGLKYTPILGNYKFRATIYGLGTNIRKPFTCRLQSSAYRLMAWIKFGISQSQLTCSGRRWSTDAGPDDLFDPVTREKPSTKSSTSCFQRFTSVPLMRSAGGLATCLPDRLASVSTAATHMHARVLTAKSWMTWFPWLTTRPRGQTSWEWDQHCMRTKPRPKILVSMTCWPRGLNIALLLWQRIQ